MSQPLQSYVANKKTNQWLFILGIIFVAFNLRPAITSIGPLVTLIKEDTGMTNGEAGFITTLPLLAFAILSSFAPLAAQKVGKEKTIFFSLILLIVGILTRSIGMITTLFIGTACIGIGVAFCNVLLPGMVKETFPKNIGLMTGIYTVAMSISAGLAPGISIPLAEDVGLGWRGSLLIWGIVAFISLLIWIPQFKRKNRSTMPSVNTKQVKKPSLYTSGIAWQLTVFMGLQSCIYFCFIAWLPEMLAVKGIDTTTAGWMVTIIQFAGIPFNFLIPVVADRLPHQKWLVLGIGLLCIIGISGLLIGGTFILLTFYIICIGIATGASLSLSLTLIALRAASVVEAADLSGMAQSIGYLLAALGPITLGLMFDFFQSWTIPFVTLLIITVIMTLAGVGAGRNQYALPKGDS